VAFPVFVLINIAEGRTSILPSWRMPKIATLTPETPARLDRPARGHACAFATVAV
jgi:hypothetical protein